MGLSSALNTAGSGLGVTSTQADILARNIANADTPGYTRKSAKLVTGPTGNVSISAIDRSVDALLSRLDRTSTSELSARNTMAEGVRAYTDYLGQPSDGGSPSALLDNLSSALITLSGTPGESAGQMAVVADAKRMAQNLNDLSGILADVSSEVEFNIRYDVSSANETLHEVAALNNKLKLSQEGTIEHRDSLDRMDKMIDSISDFMDVQVVQTRDGTINLYTGAGTELVVADRVSDLSYDGITGTLSAGSVDITPGRASARGLDQGSLSGLFALKDKLLPGFSSQLDSLAGALVQGLEDANPFGTGGTGLFTDAGGAFDASLMDGLASRIAINSEVDPAQGGSADLLQSGGLAGTPSGDGQFIDAMIGKFNDPVTVGTSGLGAGLTLSGLGTTLVTSQQSTRAGIEEEARTTRISGETISASRQNFQGVNIDDEMQKLLLVQQSYTANAKVLTAVSTMLDALLGSVR